MPRLHVSRRLRRTRYIVSNLVKNAIAPAYIRLHPSRGRLGMDGDLDAVMETLKSLGRSLRFVDIPGARIVELGPGRTPHVCAALVLCGAERLLGLILLSRFRETGGHPGALRR